MNRGCEQGFTLLEVLVATLILGIAVVGLLTNINTSMRNAGRLTEYDRAALLAKRQMDELLVDPLLPKNTVLQGVFDPAFTGDVPAGWRARLTIFETPLGMPPGAMMLERLEMDVWWGEGSQPRTLHLEGYRHGVVTPQDRGAAGL